MNGQVHTHSMLTTKGVKQGCPLSPLLFGLFVEQLHELFRDQCGDLAGVQMGGLNLLDLLYADDMAMMASILEHLDQMCEKLGQFCEEQQMEVNVPKTKYVVFRPPRSLDTWPRGVGYKGGQMEEQQCFKYMGLHVHSQRWFKDCHVHTSANAANAMWALVHKLHKSDAMPLHIKLQLCDSVVGAIANYGCQVWGVYHLDWRSEHRIFVKNPYQKLVLQFIRVITGAHSRTSREVLLRECNMIPVQVEWAKTCIKWWNYCFDQGGQDIAGAAMRQDITLLRSGCTQCWSAMFLKSMGMLGLCDSLDNLRYQDEATLRNLRLDVDRVEQAYMDKYEGLYWDTHCKEPRGRGGRHAAFIKHNCWFHTNASPTLRLKAADWQVQALTKFRLGTHRLRCNEHTVSLDQRMCQLCSSRRLEDEFHIMFECEAYGDLRHMTRWSILFKGPQNLDMKVFMCQDDQYTLSAFVHTVLRERQRMLDRRHVDVVDPELP
jgi:hypothetical protein